MSRFCGAMLFDLISPSKFHKNGNRCQRVKAGINNSQQRCFGCIIIAFLHISPSRQRISSLVALGRKIGSAVEDAGNLAAASVRSLRINV